MKAKDIKLDLVNNTWREVITLSSTLYTEITTVFVKTLKKFDSWTVTRLSKLEGGELLTSDLLVFEENLTVCMLGYTAINAQVATRFLTSGEASPIFGHANANSSVFIDRIRINF